MDIRCPECNALISASSEICPNCAYPLGKNNPVKKKRKKIIFLISMLSIVLIAIGAVCFWWFDTKYLPLKASQESFAMAQDYENEKDLDSALSYYSQVIETDPNYSLAQEKLKQLPLYISKNKLVGKAYIAAETAGLVSSLSQMSDISAGSQTVFFRYAGLGYAISNSRSFSDSNYIRAIQPSKIGMMISVYEAAFIYNGFLTEEINTIRQETSEVYFDSNKSEEGASSLYVDLDVAQYYVDAYHKTSSLSVFD